MKLKKILSAPFVVPVKAIVRKVVLGQVRHGLTAIGGALITAGYLGQGDVDTATGAALVLAGVAWSGVEKYLEHLGE